MWCNRTSSQINRSSTKCTAPPSSAHVQLNDVPRNLDPVEVWRSQWVPSTWQHDDVPRALDLVEGLGRVLSARRCGDDVDDHETSEQVTTEPRRSTRVRVRGTSPGWTCADRGGAVRSVLGSVGSRRSSSTSTALLKLPLSVYEGTWTHSPRSLLCFS